MEWISVDERFPANEQRVIICADRKYCDGRIIKIRAMAMYEDGKMQAENSAFTWDSYDMDFEYDEEVDDYIVSQGWWEQNIYGETFSAVDDFVTHWMPLPDPPK